MGGPRDTSGVGAQDLRISIFKQLPANAPNTLRRREIGRTVQLHGFRGRGNVKAIQTIRYTRRSWRPVTMAAVTMARFGNVAEDTIL